MELFESAVFGCQALALLFFATETGQICCNKFEGINDKVNELDWYLLPVEIQRMLPTILAHTQQPVFIYCYGGTTASRETLKKVYVLH